MPAPLALFAQLSTQTLQAQHRALQRIIACCILQKRVKWARQPQTRAVRDVSFPVKKCDTLNMYLLFPKLTLIEDQADPCHDQKEFFTAEVIASTLAAVCRVVFARFIAASICFC